MFKLMTALVFISSAAWAGHLQPEEGKSACFGRVYTANHMAAHPKQTLRALTVLVQNVPAGEEAGAYQHQEVRVVGEHDGVLYANTADCSYKADGGVDCQIDCDGGAFSLKPSGEGATFEVAKDYYFPLVTNDYEESLEPNVQARGKMISLDYSEREDRVYRLNPKAKAVCDKEWQRYKQLPLFGC
jgi:hypothetical protein